MKDYYTSKNDISIVILRYFNPMGAHETSIIGEEPRNNPNNLMLYIYQLTAEKINKLNIFGSDYPTPDGSCIRDYIHITDLVQGHISSLEAHNNDPGVQVYNLGKVKA